MMMKSAALVCLLLSASSTALFALFASACGGRVAPDEGSSGGTGTIPTTTPTSIPSPTRQPSPPPPVPTAKPAAPGEKATYSAHAWPGGLDHLQIYKADFTSDRCIELHLVSPMKPTPGAPFTSIAAPKDWTVQSAIRSPGAAVCSPDTKKPSLTEATDGKGTIDWKDNPKIFPCKVNVHVAVIFDDAPNVEQLDADQVSVDGC